MQIPSLSSSLPPITNTHPDDIAQSEKEHEPKRDDGDIQDSDIRESSETEKIIPFTILMMSVAKNDVSDIDDAGGFIG